VPAEDFLDQAIPDVLPKHAAFGEPLRKGRLPGAWRLATCGL
jgi:hypothetical protein